MKQIFNAGRVRRWHNNPDLSRFEDYNDAHQGRVARIILALHPKPSACLIVAALTHDDGELFAGDMTRGTKDANPELREVVRQVERVGFKQVWGIDDLPSDHLSDDEKEWLKFADRLDSYMWMKHVRPQLAHRPEWVAACDELKKTAKELNVLMDVWQVIS